VFVLQRVESSNGPIKLSGVRVAGTELATSNGPVVVDGAPGSDLAAASSNGGIDLSGVEGYVTATTSNGGITVEDCGGIAGLKTSNGPISTEISAVRGDVTISSSNGGIALRLAEDLNARVVATTSNGRVTGRRPPAPGQRVDGDLGLGLARRRGADDHRHHLKRGVSTSRGSDRQAQPLCPVDQRVPAKGADDDGRRLFRQSPGKEPP